MSSGLEWHEEDVPYTSPDNSEIVMDRSSDPLRAALAPDVAAQPGKIWNYNSGSTELVGAILKKATGKAVDQLAATLLLRRSESLTSPGTNIRTAARTRPAAFDCARGISRR